VAKTKERKRTRRPRQPKLPGMEAVSIPEIDRAAAAYLDARDNRMRLSKEETEKSDKLLEQMKRHHQTTYQYDSCVVTVLSSTKVKVKRATDSDEEESEE